MAVLEHFDEPSPPTRARITGVVYLIFFLTAVLGALVTPGISVLGGVSGDAAATAHSILANEAAYRLGLALGLISTACYVALMGLFYQLFKHVSRSLSMLAAFLGLVGCAITAVGSLVQLAPLVVLGGSSYLSVFSTEQLQALTLMFLNLSAEAGHVALVFFGLFQVLIGYVIFRSTFLPWILGVLIAVAGAGWLTYLSPPFASGLSTYTAVLGFVAELALMLWLLVVGVNEQRWNRLAQTHRL